MQGTTIQNNHSCVRYFLSCFANSR